MFRRVFVSKFQQNAFKGLSRSLSAQAAVSFKPVDDEFSKASSFDEIPGPSKFEVIRNFMPGGKFHNASLIDIQINMRQQYGDFYKMPGMFGQKTFITAYNPKDIEFIHRTEGTYPFRRGMDTMSYFRKNIRSDVYSVGGLVVEQGEDWHQMRTAVNPILMQPKIVKAYIPTIDGIVNEFMQKLPSMQDEKGEMPANFHEYLNRWSLESITAIALEKRLGLMDFNNKDNFGVEIMKLVRTIFTLGVELEMKPSLWRIYETKDFKKLMKAYNELTDLSLQMIDEAKQRYEKLQPGDINRESSVLFKLMEKDTRFATVMAFDMIFAGIDTTSSALGFTLYCLAKHPEKQDKLREELKRVMPDRDTPLTGERMKNMPYLRACLKETLRMYSPSIGNMRRTAENLVINGYQVPKGVDIMLGLLHVFRDAQNFASPEQFIPERWLRDQGVEEACPHLKQTHPFSYTPFGYGVRFCVGKRIAEMELEVFLSRLFRTHKLEWNYPDMKVAARMVVMPDSELKFKMTEV